MNTFASHSLSSLVYTWDTWNPSHHHPFQQIRSSPVDQRQKGKAAYLFIKSNHKILIVLLEILEASLFWTMKRGGEAGQWQWRAYIRTSWELITPGYTIWILQIRKPVVEGTQYNTVHKTTYSFRLIHAKTDTEYKKWRSPSYECFSNSVIFSHIPTYY